MTEIGIEELDVLSLRRSRSSNAASSASSTSAGAIRQWIM
jgi:hypothetical protein